ncbi:MAG TPA: class I SAM-dependent methyltransferase [Candidatus Binataceae bacterium]|nr:class I SAM-dependent methyltransferase [Candidatus Binataceae bacterium]
MQHDHDPADQPALPPDKEAILLQAMKEAFAHGRLGCDDWRPIVDAELRKRLYWFKHRYTPWINAVRPLNGARILEVGAGTGCSTIPLLEAGATVTSIDISPGDLQIAELRARLHGLIGGVSFRCVNAAEIGRVFAREKFDLIAYFASLEHMTYPERLSSLRAAWSLLAPGQFLAICDTPNRLWYYDDHTALQNFFHWLPDEVAVDYAERTPRDRFNTDFLHRHQDAPTRLQRWGRCASYHEFEIALRLDVGSLEVHGEWQYRRERDDPQWWTDVWANSKDGQFHRFLRLAAPSLPIAFIEPELALMIRKP